MAVLCQSKSPNNGCNKPQRQPPQKTIRAHTGLISKRVSLDAWRAQCKHEFDNNLIKSMHYDRFKLVAATLNLIMFKTFEAVEVTDGTVNAQGVEMLLEEE